jgi:tetraacyldisaccharide 4'-kinase
MKLIKPKFWDNKINFISIFLFPLSLIFLFIIFLKKILTTVHKFKIPIICVGNIYIGGTGKTPTAILLSKEISKLGKKTALLRKYYKNHVDEYKLIKNKFNNLIIGKDRTAAIRKLEKKDLDFVILDDGLQDYSIKKNLIIVCFHSNQLVGNGLILPSGPLREKLNVLKKADIVIINGNKAKNFEKKILKINRNLEIFYSRYRATNIKQFRNKKLYAVAGIGNPENFFQLIEDNNLKIKKKLVFPDHYKFSRNEIKKIVDEARLKNYQVIMTEKDYFKIKDFKINNIGYLKVTLEIKLKQKLIMKIMKLYDKNY